MWKDLKDHYGQTCAAQIYSLHTELFDVVQESDMSVSKYFSKIKLIWDQLDALDPVPICSLAYRLLLQEEIHKSISKLPVFTSEPMVSNVHERSYGNT